jgi:hypothetical protein
MGAIAEMLGRMEASTPALYAIGTMFAANARRAFDAQGKTGKWPARSVPSLAGIVQDLSEGTSVDPARFEERPALVVTGRLRNSIRFDVIADSVKLKATAPYASLHEHGGTSKQRLTPQIGKRLRSLARVYPVYGRTFRALARRADAGETLETEVPARHFLFPTEAEFARAAQILGKFAARGEVAEES